MQRRHGFLTGGVGPGMTNAAEDVIAAKRTVRDLGPYAPPPDGIGDDIDAAFDHAVRAFQERSGLRVDGFMEPGGETERNLLALRTGRGIEPPPRSSVHTGGHEWTQPASSICAVRRYGRDRT